MAATSTAAASASASERRWTTLQSVESSLRFLPLLPLPFLAVFTAIWPIYQDCCDTERRWRVAATPADNVGVCASALSPADDVGRIANPNAALQLQWVTPNTLPKQRALCIAAAEAHAGAGCLPLLAPIRVGLVVLPLQLPLQWHLPQCCWLLVRLGSLSAQWKAICPFWLQCHSAQASTALMAAVGADTVEELPGTSTLLPSPVIRPVLGGRPLCCTPSSPSSAAVDWRGDCSDCGRTDGEEEADEWKSTLQLRADK